MNASMVRDTPSFHRARNATGKFCVTCTYTEFKKTHDCVHVNSVSGDIRNWMRIKSFVHFRVKPILNLLPNTQWSSVIIPASEKEQIQLRIVFQRSVLSSVFRSSAAVLIDSRRESVSKPFKHRIQCVLCSGFAKNRGFCAHQNEVAKYVAMSNRLRDSERYLSAQKSDGSTDAEENNEVSEIPLTVVNMKFLVDSIAGNQANKKAQV